MQFVFIIILKNASPVPKHEHSRSNITNRSFAISVRPYKWSLCDPPMLACSASHGYYYKIAVDLMIYHRFTIAFQLDYRRATRDQRPLYG